MRPRRRTDPRLKVIAPGLHVPLSPGAAPDDQPVAFRLGAVLQPAHFDACPICLVADAPMSAEHVPPAVVGGTRMTSTCLDCNHGFALAKRALADHRDRALRDVHFTSDAVPGRRRTAKAMLRYADDGKFALFLMGADPGIRDALADGSISMTYSMPPAGPWRAALLKHAYLAACLHLGGIPEGPAADAVRAELVSDRHAMPDAPGEAASGVVYLRVEVEGDWPPTPNAAVAELEPGRWAVGFLLPELGWVSSPVPLPGSSR